MGRLVHVSTTVPTFYRSSTPCKPQWAGAAHQPRGLQRSAAAEAVRKGHGELAVGNVIGADILNVLFVAGLSAAVTTDGLYAKPIFFILQFPVMLFMLACFRIGIASARDAKLGRPFGFVLVVSYLIYLGLNIYWGGPE